MDGGSAYGIGNTMNVVGVGTTTGFCQAVLRQLRYMIMLVMLIESTE